jgi:hypothetical protein
MLARESTIIRSDGRYRVVRSLPLPKDVVDQLLGQLIGQLSEARAEFDRQLADARREFDADMDRLRAEVEAARLEMRGFVSEVLRAVPAADHKRRRCFAPAVNQFQRRALLPALTVDDPVCWLLLQKL